MTDTERLDEMEREFCNPKAQQMHPNDEAWLLSLARKRIAAQAALCAYWGHEKEGSISTAPMESALTAVRAWRDAHQPDRVKELEAALGFGTASDAYENLDGALTSIYYDGGHVDEVCRRTIKRVLGQLARACKALGGRP